MRQKQSENQMRLKGNLRAFAKDRNIWTNLAWQEPAQHLSDQPSTNLD